MQLRVHERLPHKELRWIQEPFFKAPDETLSQNEVYGFMKPVFGPGIVYDATKKNRQVQFQSMANGLRTARLKGYTAKIERETRMYLKTWSDEGELDLFHALSELTILTSSRCLHGDDVRENLFKVRRGRFSFHIHPHKKTTRSDICHQPARQNGIGGVGTLPRFGSGPDAADCLLSQCADCGTQKTQRRPSQDGRTVQQGDQKPT